MLDLIKFSVFLGCVILQAVTWCPWQPNVLASGGGTADRHIRLWNANTGNVLSATNTDSQVIC